MELKKISDNIFEIPKQGSMRVSARVFASEKLLEKIKQDKTLEQIKNVAMLKGIVNHALAMPDAHQGYGFPIGGVAAFRVDDGIISPGGVGFDINCGVRLLSTSITIEEFLKKRTAVLKELYRTVPSGVGKGHKEKLSMEELNEVLVKGSLYALERGKAEEEDLKRCEEQGQMKGANLKDVSERAKKRGLAQLGTLGAGNHFLELQVVEEIYDNKIAKHFNLEKGKIAVMIHCGSRGLGHQIASDYIRLMEQKYGFSDLPDRELINAPVKSELGEKYLSAMACAVNFAFCNRQIIMHLAKKVFEKFFSSSYEFVYDVCHNVAKIETHNIDKENVELCVHRKGATRSFGPGRKEIPEIYRDIGQPVLIPGSMGTASYVLVGTKKAEMLSFGSTAHGAGRVMSRHEALRSFRGEKIKQELKNKNIEIEAGSWKSIAEEAPQVYKDIDEVVKVSHALGIGNLVAKLKPMAVIKG